MAGRARHRLPDRRCKSDIHPRNALPGWRGWKPERVVLGRKSRHHADAGCGVVGAGANRTAIVLGKTSCPPLLGIEVDFFVKRTCGSSNDGFWPGLRSQRTRPITGAVLAARWSLYNGKDTPNADADLPRMLRRDAAGLQAIMPAYSAAFSVRR